jgi:hypothetical protein
LQSDRNMQQIAAQKNLAILIHALLFEKGDKAVL